MILIRLLLGWSRMAGIGSYFRNTSHLQFDGPNLKPTPGSGAPTDEESKAHEKLVVAWQEKENLALYLISQKLPSLVFMKGHSRLYVISTSGRVHAQAGIHGVKVVHRVYRNVLREGS